jgi:plastocyanin
MRRLAPLVALAVLVPAAVAWADEQVTTSPINNYDNPNPTIDQGERLTLRNNDFNSHDITSDAAGDVNGFLFQSDLAGNGDTVFVEGSQYLTTGSYSFVCSIHNEMTGTLTVTSAGTPVPRGGGGADTAAPVIVITPPATAKARSLRKKRKLSVSISSTEGATLALVARIGTKKVGKAGTELATGDNKVTVRFSKKGARRLKKGRTITLSATATDAASNAGRDDATVKLR